MVSPGQYYNPGVDFELLKRLGAYGLPPGVSTAADTASFGSQAASYGGAALNTAKGIAGPAARFAGTRLLPGIGIAAEIADTANDIQKGENPLRTAIGTAAGIGSNLALGLGPAGLPAAAALAGLGWASDRVFDAVAPSQPNVSAGLQQAAAEFSKNPSQDSFQNLEAARERFYKTQQVADNSDEQQNKALDFYAKNLNLQRKYLSPSDPFNQEMDRYQQRNLDRNENRSRKAATFNLGQEMTGTAFGSNLRSAEGLYSQYLATIPTARDVMGLYNSNPRVR
jgi:hypothetical protein